MKETHDGAFFKAQRIKKISQFIARELNEEKDLSVEGLLDWIEVSVGLSRKRARQYLDLILKLHETWIEEKGHIQRGSSQ